MTFVLHALGGEAGVLRLAEAWHRRCLADPIVAHAFSHSFHPDHTRRLAAYWVEALGGPALYSGRFGTESSVIAMHSGNGEATDMYAAGASCFAAALDDVGLSDARARRELLTWWAQASERMAAYPHDAGDVPAGLSIPRWDDGDALAGPGTDSPASARPDTDSPASARPDTDSPAGDDSAGSRRTNGDR